MPLSSTSSCGKSRRAANADGGSSLPTWAMPMPLVDLVAHPASSRPGREGTHPLEGVVPAPATPGLPVVHAPDDAWLYPVNLPMSSIAVIL